MPVYDYKFLLQSDTTNTTDAVTTNEINFGVAAPGVNRGGKFGMHIVVTTAFGSLTEGAIFWILHGASATLTTSSIKHTGMFIPVAQLLKGAHFFVPCGSVPLLQYVCGMFDAVNTAANAGKTTIWLGDAEDWDKN